MSKILLFTDNHFCSTSSIVRKRGKRYTLRLENQLDTMKWLTETAIENNCYEMFCLGDFFNNNNLNAEELACLSEINFQNIPAHFIVGNHEMGNASLEYSSTHSFLINQNCCVYNKPAILGIGNTLIYILPYELEINRKENIMDYFPAINVTDNIKYKVLLTHNDISGISMGKFISKEGFSLENLSSNFDLVINGHIHNQSWVAQNVLNLGNITGLNFSEDCTKYKHQCMILDCDTLQYQLITNPFAFNFSKMDFTGENDNIDYINKASTLMGRNSVCYIKCNEENSYYIKHRFDPEIEDDGIVPRSCNMVCVRIVVEKDKNTLTQDTSKKQSDKEFKLDYLTEFQNYITQELGTDQVILTELESILK